MDIVGFCRFSMLGHGDWGAYRADRPWQESAAEVAKELFRPARLERRFEAFEHLFIPSMNAQTDQDFTVAVMSSNAMPEEYRERLVALCARTTTLRPFFLEPMPVVQAQRQVVDELGIDWAGMLQFRLDDDDCLFHRFIETTRAHGRRLASLPGFGISYPNVLVSVAYSDHDPVTYLRWAPFMSCGLSLRHPAKSVFSWIQHKHVPRYMVSVTDPNFHPYMTHRDDNDRRPYDLNAKRAEGLMDIGPAKLARIMRTQYAYIGPEGGRILGQMPVPEGDDAIAPRGGKGKAKGMGKLAGARQGGAKRAAGLGKAGGRKKAAQQLQQPAD